MQHMSIKYYIYDTNLKFKPRPLNKVTIALSVLLDEMYHGSVLQCEVRLMSISFLKPPVMQNKLRMRKAWGKDAPRHSALAWFHSE